MGMEELVLDKVSLIYLERGRMIIITPRYTIIEDGAINKIEEVLKKLNLRNPLIVTGRNTKKYCKFSYDIEYYDEILSSQIIEHNYIGYDCIIGVGGGRAIDTGKYLAHKLGIPFISVPTTASNDGIASPIVSIKQPSFMADAPIAIIADTEIIKKSPKRLLSAGMGDIVSNITAVLDWKLAYKEKGEKYSESSAIFSKTIAKELISYVLNSDLLEYHNKLVKALVGSGIAIAIAKMCAIGDIGCDVNISFENERDIFSESLSRAIIEVKPENIQAFNDLTEKIGISYVCIGKTGGDVLSINSLYRNMDKVKDVYFNRFREIIEQDL